MAKNFVQEGDVITFIAPSGGVVSGTPIFIGGQFVVPLVSVAQGATFAGRVTGVWDLPKATGASTDLTEGQAVFWDATAGTIKRVSASGLRLCGIAVSAASTSATTARVAINQQALPAQV